MLRKPICIACRKAHNGRCQRKHTHPRKQIPVFQRLLAVQRELMERRAV